MAAAKAKKRTPVRNRRLRQEKPRKGAGCQGSEEDRQDRAAKAAVRGRGPAPGSSGGGSQGLRVRMYRVGFGDFFLLTVPIGRNDERHILIDCGVHAVDLGSIQDAVKQMAADCGKHLSLVIMTHRHADHISGFAKCADVFSQITVWASRASDKSSRTIHFFRTIPASRALDARVAARKLSSRVISRSAR